METKYIMIDGNDYKVVVNNGKIQTVQHTYWRMANSRARQITKQIKEGGPLFKKIADMVDQ